MAEAKGLQIDRLRGQISKIANNLETAKADWEASVNQDIIQFAIDLLNLTSSILGKIRLEVAEEEEEETLEESIGEESEEF